MRDWWLRTLLVLQRPRPVFVALRDDTREAAGDRSEQVLLIVLLADAVLAQVLAGVARTPRGGAEQAAGQALLGWLLVAPFLVRRSG